MTHGPDPFERWLADLDRTDYPLPDSLARPPATTRRPMRAIARAASAAAAIVAVATGVWLMNRDGEAPALEAPAASPPPAPVARLERAAPIAFERRVATIHAGSHTIESVRRTHAAGREAGE